MTNVHGHGTWRCVCELDTVHIHVIEVANHVLKLAIGNLHLLSCPVLCKLAWVFLTSNHPSSVVLMSWMSNVHGTWRCVCGLDTVHIHVMKVANQVVELAKGNLHLLPRAVQAGLGVSDPQLPEFGGLEVVGEQCAWYVEVCE